MQLDAKFHAWLLAVDLDQGLIHKVQQVCEGLPQKCEHIVAADRKLEWLSQRVRGTDRFQAPSLLPLCYDIGACWP